MSIKHAILIFSLLALHGCSLAKYTIEHAPYTTIESDEHVEIRHYASLTLVTTPMQLPEQARSQPATDDSESAEYSPENDNAFRRLFNYISGENSQAQDISMTAPVFMDENKAQTMSFVLPDTLTPENAPTPNSKHVTIENIQDYRVAVIQFSGTLDKDTIEEQKAALIAWLIERKITPLEPTMIAGYDPPLSLPIFRRNEVLIPIE